MNAVKRQSMRLAGLLACTLVALLAVCSPASGAELKEKDIAGSSWGSNYSEDIVEFRKGGVVAFRSEQGTAYGQWKVDQDVLLFDKNGYSHYEAKLDGDWLTGKMSNADVSVAFRWYRIDSERLNRMMKQDIDQLFEDFHKAVEAARLSVLNESPGTEKKLQQGKGEQDGGKHWLGLCEDPKMRAWAVQIAYLRGVEDSELCYHWYGTRHEWKETILRQGCQGRCR